MTKPNSRVQDIKIPLTPYGHDFFCIGAYLKSFTTVLLCNGWKKKEQHTVVRPFHRQRHPPPQKKQKKESKGCMGAVTLVLLLYIGKTGFHLLQISFKMRRICRKKTRLWPFATVSKCGGSVKNKNGSGILWELLKSSGSICSWSMTPPKSYLCALRPHGLFHSFESLRQKQQVTVSPCLPAPTDPCRLPSKRARWSAVPRRAAGFPHLGNISEAGKAKNKRFRYYFKVLVKYYYSSTMLVRQRETFSLVGSVVLWCFNLVLLYLIVSFFDSGVSSHNDHALP